MSFRTVVLPALDTIDSIAGPNYLDIRTTTCQIIKRVWTSGIIGKGGPTGFVDTVVVSLPNYIRIRHLTEREIANSGGRYELGSVVIGPVRPQWTAFDGTTGGFSQSQLAPNGDQGTAIIHRLTPLDPADIATTGIAGDYRVKDIKRDRSMRFMLFANRQSTTPGP